MARPPAETGKTLSTRQLVTINRDMTAVTPKVIWAHERPILEEIFGDGMVKDADATTLDEGFKPVASKDFLAYNKKQDSLKKPSESQGFGFVFIGDPQSEYQRLAEVYGKHSTDNMANVEKIFGRFQSGMFTRALGDKPEITDLPVAQLRQLIESSGSAPAGEDKDMTKEEKAVAAKERAAFLSADKATLLAMAKEHSVEI
jgi:hypothetical protein